MERDSLIASIQDMNPTAAGLDLLSFDLETLRRYVSRLSRVSEPRGGASRWSRESSDPAITKYVPSGA